MCDPRSPFLRFDMVDDEEEYVFFVYVDNREEEIYFILEEQIGDFVRELYNPEYVSFTGVTVKALTPEGAVIKYKDNDVFSSEEPKQTVPKGIRPILKHILPKSVKIELYMLAVNILSQTEQNETILQQLSKGWAMNSHLTKEETLSCLRDELKQILEEE